MFIRLNTLEELDGIIPTLEAIFILLINKFTKNDLKFEIKSCIISLHV